MIGPNFFKPQKCGSIFHDACGYFAPSLLSRTIWFPSERKWETAKTTPAILRALNYGASFHFGDQGTFVLLQAKRDVIAQFGNRQQPPGVFSIRNGCEQIGLCFPPGAEGRFGRII
jgi:hypothetical protein